MIRNIYSLRSTISTLLFLAFSGVLSSAQEYIFEATTIGVNDGLPHRIVYDIQQDSKGFIWIATKHTVTKYDGYRFKSYNLTEYDFPEGAALKIRIDEQDRIWYIAIDTGPEGVKSSLSGIINDRTGDISPLEIAIDSQFMRADEWLVDLRKGHDNEVLLITNTGRIHAFKDNLRTLYSFGSDDATNIIAIPGGGYKCFNRTKIVHLNPIGKIDSITKQPNAVQSWNPIYTNSEIKPSLLEDIDSTALLLFIEDHKLAYSKQRRFFIYDQLSRKKYTFLQQKAKLTYGSIYRQSTGIIKDQNGLYWISTEDGILKIALEKSNFSTSHSNNSIRHIYHDGDSLWIGGYTYNQLPDPGLQAFTQQFKDYSVPFSFFKGKEESTWIRVMYHLVKYNPNNQQFQDYPFKEMSNNFLLHANKNNETILIATNNKLYHLEEQGGQFQQVDILPVEKVKFHHFYQNNAGIWLSTDKGIFLLDQNGQQLLQHFNQKDGLPNEDITNLHEDKKGVFWLATRQAGLIKWDRSKQNFQQFTVQDGLSHNSIHAVYEHNNTLWLPSDYGLMAFDKNTYDAKVYFPIHGTAHEEFNYKAHFQAKDGTLYLGGLNGVTAFKPSQVLKDSINTPLYVVGVKTLNEDQEDYEDYTLTYQNSRTIELAPDNNILSIEVALLDYSNYEANQYAYRLVGKQKQWIYTKEPKFSLFNLPYGKYDLQVRARGSSGIWSSQELLIPITVRKPFYLQNWFMVLTTICFLLVVFVGIKWRLKALEKTKQQLELEVKNRTKTIQQQKESLQQLDKTKTRFFSNITHEFRTPLTLIIGPLEQALEDRKLPKIFKRRLVNIINNAKHLLSLINQILDISKIEGGSMQLAVTRGDIIQYTYSILEQFEVLFEQKSQHFTFVSNVEKWETNFDSDKWNKIIYNLLSNAIKYTPTNQHIQMSLVRSRHKGQECIRLDVKDTGMGIAEAQLGKIFNRFYQVDDSSKRLQGGTGIGLALVKELVELQGGKIQVYSQLHQGTSFEVFLPVLAATYPKSAISLSTPILPITLDSPTKRPKQPIKLMETNRDKLEVVLIEDNEEMRAYISYCLDAAKYHITEASNGEDGLLKVQSIIPDLIISDVMMPKKNGFEVVETVRQDLVTSHIPIILLTARAALESRLEGLQRGADAYLTKPFSPKELALRIEKLIEIRQLLQKRYEKKIPISNNKTYQKEDQFIKNLRNYILEHLDESNLSGDKIGKHFGMSRVHLYRKLKALTDQSISEFVKQIRLQKAKELLTEGELNISEITYRTGFSSLSYFSRSFKKAYGKAPSEM